MGSNYTRYTYNRAHRGWVYIIFYLFKNANKLQYICINKNNIILFELMRWDIIKNN